MNSHYDIIVIGSGAGGGTMALALAPTGKRILLLERGNYLRREQDNWDPDAVFVRGKYQAKETWYDREGRTFHPGLHYFVGGNTKVYGGALFRLRPQDFEEIVHADGLSPAWPVGYAELEPYYTAAERLFHVHGLRGLDPTEGWASAPYPHPPVRHEPRIQALCDALERKGHHPFPQPLAILLEEDADGQVAQYSSCIRCSAYDGFPCLTNGKADAQIICVDPALGYKNVTLMTGAYVDRLETDPRGHTVTSVHVRIGDELATYYADIVVVAAGALSSSLLMFRSANTAHPAGLANGSGQVGRNYMRHNNSAFMAVSREPNDTTYQKTMALNDFYFGADDWEYPLGGIQTLGKSHGTVIKAEALPHFLSWFPDMPFDVLARHAVDFWLMTEDLPRPENRIELKPDGRVVLTINPTSDEAHRRLRHKFEELLSKVDVHPHLLERSLYLGKNVPIGGTAHQAGTMRFGTDPAASVLDTNCKAHQLDNLYVTDAGFFPSIGAVNPTLTIIANALRVADHLKVRLGVSSDLAASTSTSAPAAMAAPATATHG
jgi:choline dehydrogenase-like flavoprotein